MMKIPMLLITFVILCGLTVQCSEDPAPASPFKRYVVAEKGIILKADTIDQIKDDIKIMSGNTQKDLRYHRGFVANMTPKAAELLREKYPVLVELDAIATISSGCEEDPRPPNLPDPDEPPPKQPPQEVQWGIKAVNAENLAFRGNGVIVCIVDTGIWATHPDLVANIIGGENFVSSAENWNDDNGHGTHVAGVVAALDNDIGVVGVAPEASLFAVKVLDALGSGYMSDVAEGIRSCVENKTHVINMSLGSSSPSFLVEEAVKEAHAAGILVIVAAGNDSRGPVSYPAAYPETIAVSSITESLNLSSFSNIGPEINFAGPGSDIYSTMFGGTYETLSGTSMAAPHVAGVASLAVEAGKPLKGRNIGLELKEQGEGLVDSILTLE